MNVDTILAWLSGNPYLNLIFLFLAAGSVLTSIFLYFKSKKSKEPKYLVKSFSVIEDSVSSIEKLEIKYGDLEVKRLTISKLSFWNGGHDTIEGRDIASADKLRVSLQGDGEIITAKPILQNREATNIDSKVIENEMHITFDFLDYGDGAIFEIYHTGSLTQSLKVFGTIKGGHAIQYGEYKDDYMANKIFVPLDYLLEKFNIKNGSLAAKMLILFLLPICFPLYFLLSPIDKVVSLFFRVPKEYDLSSSGTPYNKLHRVNKG